MEIQIHDNTGDSGVDQETIIDSLTWLCSELQLTAKTIDVIFTDDQTLKDLHKNFLNDNTFTDVMTFNLSDVPPIESEIYISIDRARENARAFNVSFQNEIMRLIIVTVLTGAVWFVVVRWTPVLRDAIDLILTTLFPAKFNYCSANNSGAGSVQ